MCGIAGIIGSLANKELLKSLLATISYRGEPRYQNENYVNEHIALGTNRLAIVDEHHGQQPKIAEDGTVICIFNGEIYNHVQLREELSEFYEFETECDTEVILKSYLKWGGDFCFNFEGQFAIAIFDKNTSEIFLVRDSLGIKPLYYSIFQENLIFASEAKSIAKCFPQEIIHELKPGSIYHNGTIERYSNLAKFNAGDFRDNIQINSAKKSLKVLLEQAIQRRIPKNCTKVACMLSGGIDSSLIAYIAKKFVPEVTAYTLAAPNTPTEDLLAAKRVCQLYDIKQIIVTPNTEDMQNFYLHTGVEMLESFEPILVRNAVSYYFVCKRIVEDGFKFCFSGEGADELFGGYDFIREVPQEFQDDLIWDSLDIISNTYLKMSDRAAMHATLEARVPFMDRELVDFALSLPSFCRINKETNKYILREAFREELPAFICDKVKIGMNEGAGYGANISKSSIYFKAIENFYHSSSSSYDADFNICKKYAKIYSINLEDLEEIYNFSRYINLEYTRIKMEPIRLQLNGKLLPKYQRTLSVE